MMMIDNNDDDEEDDDDGDQRMEGWEMNVNEALMDWLRMTGRKLGMCWWCYLRGRLVLLPAKLSFHPSDSRLVWMSVMWSINRWIISQFINQLIN